MKDLSDEENNIVTILALLTNNASNSPNNNGALLWRDSIHQAAHNGHLKIVKILAPLTDNPNVQIIMEGLQFIRQHKMGTQKLSKF